MKNKYVIFAMVLALLVTIVGCSGGQTKNNPGSNSNQSSGEKKGDDSGETNKKLLDKPRTIKVMLEANFNPDLMILDRIEELTNVRVEIETVSSQSYDQKMQTLIATNNLPDVVYMRKGKPYFAEAAKNGMFVSLTDNLEYAPNLARLLEEDPDISKNEVDGVLYSFPKHAYWRLQLAQAPMIRVDLIEKLGLERPETFEDLYDVLKAFKAAYPESIPFTNREGATSLLYTLGFALGSGYTSNNVYYDPDIDGGRYVFAPSHPNFKVALEYLHRLYKDKLLDPDYAVNTGDVMKEKLASGRAFLYFDNNSFGEQFNMALQIDDPSAKFDLLLPMENSFGQKRNWMYPPHWGHHHAISSKAKNPEEIIKFLDWMYSEEGVLVTNYGVEGEHFNMVNGEPVIAEEILEKYRDVQDPFRTMQADLGLGFGHFTLSTDERPFAMMSSDELNEWSTQFIPENGYIPGFVDPPLSDQEIDRLKTLNSKIETIVLQELDKFIIGTRSLDEFDKFAQQLIDNGALEVEQIFNDALQRHLTRN